MTCYTLGLPDRKSIQQHLYEILKNCLRTLMACSILGLKSPALFHMGPSKVTALHYCTGKCEGFKI